MGKTNDAVLCIALFCMIMAIILLCIGASLITEHQGAYQDNCEVLSMEGHTATVYGGCTINEYSFNTESSLCLLFGLVMMIVGLFAMLVGTGAIEF